MFGAERDVPHASGRARVGRFFSARHRLPPSPPHAPRLAAPVAAWGRGGRVTAEPLADAADEREHVSLRSAPARPPAGKILNSFSGREGGTEDGPETAACLKVAAFRPQNPLAHLSS
ncbi:hypothetical protein SKAU_G00199240 [Synaphobranchus kaupii]|uniref:Uncharacterized protein n=1 Tax=Synaphobranchus kaupii TaxID=118154 RepID=A0A9Q1IY84_SYNKA|nr:hypothetical protein SKAU_G00199240 [Synaphobranchus kaupii]